MEEQNAMTTARRESTFRMSKLRNGFVSGSLERQPGVGRRSSKAGWGDFEGGAAKKERVLAGLGVVLLLGGVLLLGAFGLVRSSGSNLCLYLCID